MKTRSVVLALALLTIGALACGTSPTPTPVPPQPTSPPAPTAPPQPTSPPATSGGDVPLTLYNTSGQDVCFVHISPTSSDTWGEDWLGSSEIIADGDNHTFNVTPGTYDLQALDCSQGEIEVEWELEVTSSTAWAVDGESTSSGGGGDTGGGSSATLTLVNASGQDVCFVHISPTSSDTWGDDWLGSSEIVADGDNHTFTVAPGTYDLQALDCNQGEIEVQWEVAINGGVTWTVGAGTVSGGGDTGGEGGGSSGGTADSTLTLQNYLEVPICYVYIRTTGSADWGDDQLGSSEILDAGASRDFSLPAATYDLRAEDCSREQLYQEEGIPVSGAAIVSAGGGRGGAGDGPATLTLVNNNDVAIDYVYIAPATGAEGGSDWLSQSTIVRWGDDWLDDEEWIEPGTSRTFSVPAGTYNLRADGGNHIPSEGNGMLWAVDLQGDQTWTVSDGGGENGGSSGGGSGSSGSEDELSVNLLHYGDQDLCDFYIYPSSQGSTGDDWLADGEVVSPGGTRFYRFPANGTYLYNIRVDYCDGSEPIINENVDFITSHSMIWSDGNRKRFVPTETHLTLHNRTGQEICYVYYYPVGSDSWGENLLGSSTPAAGGNIRYFNVPAGIFDLRAEDCNHQIVDLLGSVDLRGNHHVSWYAVGDGGTSNPPPSGGTSERTLNLFNESGQTICYVYISPTTSDVWGDDWLGSSEVIESGASRTFAVPPGDYDMRVDNCSQEAIDVQGGVTIGAPINWRIGPGGGEISADR